MPQNAADFGHDAAAAQCAETGCAFPTDESSSSADASRRCGIRRRPGSAYCPTHHALCHPVEGSPVALRRLAEIEALAATAGGRWTRAERGPPPNALHRIERRARAFLRANRSRFVQQELAMPKRRMPPIVAEAEGRSPNGATGPTPERLARGDVERLPGPIADRGGAPSRPYRAVDTLAVMQRRGTITAGMRQAGEDFRARFAVAQLHPLRTLDLSQLRGVDRSLQTDGTPPGLRIEAARRTVWQAIRAVGGIASPAGSCLWHVLGWERTLKDWALEQGWNGRRVSPEAAAGILVAGLGALEQHFGTS
jgi:hypothetical protein